MDLGKDQQVVSVKSQVYLADGRQFQYTESRHKLDKFRFVDFAKRQKEWSWVPPRSQNHPCLPAGRGGFFYE